MRSQRCVQVCMTTPVAMLTKKNNPCLKTSTSSVMLMVLSSETTASGLNLHDRCCPGKYSLICRKPLSSLTPQGIKSLLTLVCIG